MPCAGENRADIETSWLSLVVSCRRDNSGLCQKHGCIPNQYSTQAYQGARHEGFLIQKIAAHFTASAALLYDIESEIVVKMAENHRIGNVSKNEFPPLGFDSEYTFDTV